MNPISFHSYLQSSEKALALEEELRALISKGAVEPAPTSPGYYSRMFVVQKSSGAWRPIIDLSHLNKFILKTKFRMETVQSVLSSVRRGDWMFSLDLKDAYLQVPMHEESRKYLRFVTSKGIYQFKALCFGLTTAPQVFTRVMAPVAAILHSLGIRMLRYLDDWLVLASSIEECLRARDTVLSLCADLGIQLNLEKSSLTPSQVSIYLGIEINTVIFRASPSLKRRDSLALIVGRFLSSKEQPASLWRSLLGHLASLTQLIPGGRLRTRSLQLTLRALWDFVNEEILIPWNKEIKQDLLWWLTENRLEKGISLKSVLPDQALWSDASDLGWGAFLLGEGRSGLWSPLEKSLSINKRELMAVFLGLQAFEEVLSKTVAIYCDNTTAIAYLRNQGGTLSESLNQEAQAILRWAEERGISLVPQFILGVNNVYADSLSRPNQMEWTLNQEEFDALRKKWPVNVDLFATSLNYRCPVFYAPMKDSLAAGVDAFLQNWENLQAYAFPPFPMIRKVLNKVMESPGLVLTLIAPYWPAKEWFPDLCQLLLEPPIRLPERVDLLRQPHFHRFHLSLGSLHLHAWRLSGEFLGRQVCQEQSLNN